MENGKNAVEKNAVEKTENTENEKIIKTVENLFNAYENERKNKNKLYSVKTGEKYNSLSIKSAGMEKIRKLLDAYKCKNEKEKQQVEFYKNTTYYGKDTAQQQQFIIELLNS